MKPHPGRCVQAMDRLTDVLRNEFDDLTPPDALFVLYQLAWTWHLLADKQITKEGKP